MSKDVREKFEAWLCREMPEGTIIGNPNWWANKIWQAAHAESAARIAELEQKLADAEIDARRWRKGVADKEFGVYRNGEYMHISRVDGRIIFGDSWADLIDKTIAHDESVAITNTGDKTT